MSCKRYGLIPAANERTGCALAKAQSPKLARLQSAPVLPHGYVVPVIPRAPISHSASVGTRFPPQPQYRLASSQLTHDTGQFAEVPVCHAQGGATHTAARTHASYAPWVTSVSSIEKSETLTR